MSLSAHLVACAGGVGGAGSVVGGGLQGDLKKFEKVLLKSTLKRYPFVFPREGVGAHGGDARWRRGFSPELHCAT